MWKFFLRAWRFLGNDEQLQFPGDFTRFLSEVRAAPVRLRAQLCWPRTGCLSWAGTGSLGGGDGERLSAQRALPPDPARVTCSWRNTYQFDFKPNQNNKNHTMNQCSFWSWGCPPACTMRRPWQIFCGSRESRSPPSGSVIPPVWDSQATSRQVLLHFRSQAAAEWGFVSEDVRDGAALVHARHTSVPASSATGSPSPTFCRQAKEPWQAICKQNIPERYIYFFTYKYYSSFCSHILSEWPVLIFPTTLNN